MPATNLLGFASLLVPLRRACGLGVTWAFVFLCAFGSGCSSNHGTSGSDGGDPDAGPVAHPTPGPGQASAWMITDAKDLIDGPSTGGRVGDWMLANGRVRFIIEGAHTSDGYDPYGGSIVAADLQRATGGESRWGEAFMGLNFRAAGCDEVTLASDGSDGAAASVVATGSDAESPFMASLFAQGTTPPALHAVILRTYSLGPDDAALTLTLTIQNNGAEPLTLRATYLGLGMNRGLAHWVPQSGYAFDLALTDVNRSAEFYAAVGEQVSYSVLNVDAPFSPLVSFAKILIGQYPQITVPAGQARAFRFWVAVGTGDVGSLQRVHDEMRASLPTSVPLEGTVTGPAGEPVPMARVHVALTASPGSAQSMARTDAQGKWRTRLPTGNYTLSAMADDRPFTSSQALTLDAGGKVDAALTLGATAQLDVTANENGMPIPVKLVAEPTPQNPRRVFPAPFGERWARQPVVAFAETGHATLRLSPGEWKIFVSRGFEYDQFTQLVTLVGGVPQSLLAPLHRMVDTAGWMGADLHVHAQGSADADDLLLDKVRAFAGEGLEIPVSTEHEFIGDFAPAVDRLSMGAFMHVVTGTELTTTAIGHFNVFPLTQLLTRPNRGAFDWFQRPVPSVIAEARKRIQPGGLVPLIQLNHPRALAMAYLDAVQFEPRAFVAGANAEHFLTDFDAIEVWNGEPLVRFMGCAHAEAWCTGLSSPQPPPAHPQLYDWFAWLVRGKRITATGNSDSHSASLRSVGFPRTYVQVASDAPADMTDALLLSSLRAQKAMISGGPFLLITAKDSNGATVGPGGLASATPGTGGASITLHLDLQAPAWMGPLAILDLWHGDVSAPNLPGKILKSLDLTSGLYKENSAQTRRLVADVDVVVQHDDFIVAVVRGPVDAYGNSSALWPVVQTNLPPVAITNPIWIDANGDGVLTPIVP